jgi:DNA-binding IclR family transcriptional regulator
MTAAAEPFFATRTLHAMEVLVFRPSSARQVAGELRVDARTARRLLNRLVEEGWATRTEDRERIYAPTLRIVALAAQLVERAPLVRQAMPRPPR